VQGAGKKKKVRILFTPNGSASLSETRSYFQELAHQGVHPRFTKSVVPRNPQVKKMSTAEVVSVSGVLAGFVLTNPYRF
jgi:hypothetical protein